MQVFTFLTILLFGTACNGPVKKDLPKENELGKKSPLAPEAQTAFFHSFTNHEIKAAGIKDPCSWLFRKKHSNS
jgi:hypothetical protein